MSFILSKERDTDDYGERREALWLQYQAHLESQKDQFPPGAFALATSDWWYGFDTPAAPHDARLTAFQILSQPGRARNELTIKLRSSFGGQITLRYPRLLRYELRTPGPATDRTYRFKACNWSSIHRMKQIISRSIRKAPRQWWGIRSVCPHGDWRYDEFGLSPDGFLVHTIEWAKGPVWVITADDLIHSYDPEASQ